MISVIKNGESKALESLLASLRLKRALIRERLYNILPRLVLKLECLLLAAAFLEKLGHVTYEISNSQ